ncbi:MAG: type II/IV secretion system ATPase subunit [Halobacteria archaeon]
MTDHSGDNGFIDPARSDEDLQGNSRDGYGDVLYSKVQEEYLGSPGTVDSDITKDVYRFFEDEDGLQWGTPDREFLESSFFYFGYMDRYNVAETYWVQKPYTYTSVLHEEGRGRYIYYLSEPLLDEYEEYVLRELDRVLSDVLMYVDVGGWDERGELFDVKSIDLIEEFGRDLSPGSLYKIYYYLKRYYVHYGKITQLLRDRKIEDISCDGTGIPIYVYHREYRDMRTNVLFQNGDVLDSYISRLAQKGNKLVSTSDPLVDTSLPNGSRIQLTYGSDVSTKGSNFTVRNFSEEPITPVDLIDWNTFSLEEMVYFWLAIQHNLSLIFVGGTASGKTTSLNAVSFFIPPESKIVTIEDTREIKLPQENWISSVTRESLTGQEEGEVNIYDLLEASFRQRPEYLLVGEIRAQHDVALAFFQAMSTGHTSYTTFHAESVKTVLNRMESEPLDVPPQMLESLDIISIQKQTYRGDKRVRRNEKIVELGGFDDEGEYNTNEVFEWNPMEDVHEKHGDSFILEKIREERGWSRKELNREIVDRKKLLNYLLENDIRYHELVANVVMEYWTDKELVMEHVNNGTLEESFILDRE